MALLKVTPEQFAAMGAWETDMLAREVGEIRKAEIDFRIALAKAGGGV